MAEIPKIVLPHGGYRKLIVYKKSDVIYEGSLLFCRRFLPRFGDRTVDQMIQAARSCKQNIVEGSAASGTSKETEIKLTNVARASLPDTWKIGTGGSLTFTLDKTGNCGFFKMVCSPTK